MIAFLSSNEGFCLKSRVVAKGIFVWYRHYYRVAMTGTQAHRSKPLGWALADKACNWRND
jgi:hypothetical protein